MKIGSRTTSPFKALVFKVFAATAAAAVVLAVPGYAPQAEAQSRVGVIVVSGNQALTDATIAAIAGLALGETYSPAEINEALRRLNDSGLFAKAEIFVSGGTVNIVVVENNFINIVNFEGNRKFSDEDLATVVTSAARQPFNRTTAEADARRIALLYQQEGQLEASVRPLTIPLADGNVNLVFEITESGTPKINRITFVGNETFSDSRLRGVVTSSVASIFTFLGGNNRFSPQQVAQDRNDISEFYQRRGYPDVAVRSSTGELAQDRSGVFLTYSITEGGRYVFGESSVTSAINGVDASDYANLVRSRSGAVFNVERVRDTVDAIESRASRNGLPFLRVNPRYVRNDASGTLDVVYELTQGQRAFVERIDISGNTQTLERVVRRHIRFAEGDAFNARSLRELERALQATRLFGTVSVEARQGSSADQAIVDIKVTEAATGSFSFGAGYSTDTGFNGQISLSESNFMGRGQRVNFEISVSEDSYSGRIAFTEPSIAGRDLSGGFDIFYRSANREESSYQTVDFGLNTNLGFPTGEDSRMNVTYEISSKEIYDVAVDASLLIADDAGTAVTSAFGVEYTWDKRNNPVEPTEGFVLRGGTEYAGLGGDVQYLKPTFRAKGYKGFFDDKVVLTAEIEGGGLLAQGGEHSRVTDRFFLGGQSMRGFTVSGIGPRDLTTDNDDALGGDYYAVARLEASFPIGLPREAGIYGGVFADIGSVWGLGEYSCGGCPTVGEGGGFDVDDAAYLRASAGLTLFWATPIGPLQFNWAWPIQALEYDITETFSISVGTRF